MQRIKASNKSDKRLVDKCYKCGTIRCVLKARSIMAPIYNPARQSKPTPTAIPAPQAQIKPAQEAEVAHPMLCQCSRCKAPEPIQPPSMLDALPRRGKIECPKHGIMYGYCSDCVKETCNCCPGYYCESCRNSKVSIAVQSSALCDWCGSGNPLVRVGTCNNDFHIQPSDKTRSECRERQLLAALARAEKAEKEWSASKILYRQYRDEACIEFANNDVEISRLESELTTLRQQLDHFEKAPFFTRNLFVNDGQMETKNFEDVSDEDFENLFEYSEDCKCQGCAELRYIIKLRQQLKEEIKIVDRVWDALGIVSYEQAGGKYIHEIVAEMRQQLKDSELHELRQISEAYERGFAAGEQSGFNRGVVAAGQYADDNPDDLYMSEGIRALKEQNVPTPKEPKSDASSAR